MSWRAPGLGASPTRSASCSGTVVWRRPTSRSARRSSTARSSVMSGRYCRIDETAPRTAGRMIVLGSRDRLDLDRYRRIVVEREAVAIDPAALTEVATARRRLLAHLDTGAAAYGVTTSVGYLATTRLDARAQRAFQRALLARG